jgi:hypothetical protein
MAIKKVRVYFPLGSEYYMESPWVRINGKPAFEPVEGQPQLKLADVVHEAVEKGKAFIDKSMCLTDCYESAKTETSNPSQADHKGKYGEIANHGKEFDQIELTLATSGGEDGVSRIGLSDFNLGIFDGALVADDTMTVGGTFGADTLKVVGRLANYGFLKLEKLHFEADAEGFFATTPLLKTFSHTGVCISDQRLHYPKAKAEDDNTNIRTMDEKYLAAKNIDTTLHGKNYLEIITPKERSVNMTLYTCFYPKS